MGDVSRNAVGSHAPITLTRFLCASFFISFLGITVEAAELKNSWIPGWQPTSTMTIARAGAAIVSHKNQIYIIGGVDGVNFLDSVESASINSDGSLSSWRVVSKIPEPRGFVSAAVYAERIYVVGGGNGPYGKQLLNSIVSVPIFANGELGEWRVEQEKMLTPRRCSKVIVKDNVLHVIGGFSGALLDTVESSTFLKNGKLSSWVMQKNQMTMPRYVNEVKKVDNYAVVIGGHHPSKGMGISDVEYADLNDADLMWRTAPSMKTGRYAFSGAAHNNYLYAMGGISGTEYLNSTEKLAVTNMVESNKWSVSTNLPAYMANFTTLVIEDSIYLVGGSTRYKYMANVWVAKFNSFDEIGYYGTKQELDAFNSLTQTKKTVTNLPNSGTVLESVATDGYTYLRVLTRGKEIWLAAPKMDVPLNKKIRFSEGVYMSNFRSKTLHRDFAAILFVGTVVVE
ncbi:MAG: hypothetical protein OEM38_04505 [Gammaproteobacteria bacterium]|nr:hypothetical protein [Gammaproteobacteria bacterium]